MEKLVSFFDEFWSASKPLPVVLFFLGVVLLLVADEGQPNSHNLLSGAGTFLVVVALLSLLLRVIERRTPGARISSLVFDGFLFGLVAGLTGGLIGFGVQEQNSLESIFVRTLIATIYSISIGGLLGAVFVFLHRENRGILLTNVPLFILVVLALVGVTFHVSSSRMPVFLEGIRGWEIFIIFSIFTVCMILRRGLSSRYNGRLVISRLVLCLVLQAATFLFLLAVPAPLPGSGFDGSLLTSTIYEGLRGTIAFGIVIFSGVGFQLFIYFVSTEDLRVLRLWDRKFLGSPSND